MPAREALLAAADVALTTIDGTGPTAWRAIAVAVAELDNKDASAAIRRWLASPRGPRRWRSASEAIWIERLKLRAEHAQLTENG